MSRELVRAEWRRAQEAFNAALVLTREGFWADAVSRAYYGVLHAAKAALLVQDVEAKSHAGVKRMFGLHLIKVGAIKPKWADYLPAGLDDRLSAD